MFCFFDTFLFAEVSIPLLKQRVSKQQFVIVARSETSKSYPEQLKNTCWRIRANSMESNLMTFAHDV